MAHHHNRTDTYEPEPEYRHSSGVFSALLVSLLTWTAKLVIIVVTVFMLLTYGCSYAAGKIHDKTEQSP